MINLQQVNTIATRVYMGTLTEGEELHPAMIRIAKALNVYAATFELLGGLTDIEFSEFNIEQQRHVTIGRLQRKTEIVGGHGTISLLNDEPHVHVHLVVSPGSSLRRPATASYSGHVMRAVVYAVEFTLTCYDGAPVRRAMHPATGLMLWDTPPLSG
jgi:predicted DNA-binding protein with PD1-like motif